MEKEIYYDAYCWSRLVAEQEKSFALALECAESRLEQLCCDGDLEFGEFEIDIYEYDEDLVRTGNKMQVTIVIEDQPTDFEEHSIYNAHDLGVRCGKRF